MRLDQFLVENEITESRTRAQDLIRAGKVKLLEADKHVGIERLIKKPGYEITQPEAAEVLVESFSEHKYVSRAGIKLDGALSYLGLSVCGQIALDIGQSTGGFTDCLLKNNIGRVIGIDVGKEQLHESLKKSDQVEFYEGVNARVFDQVQLLAGVEPESIDLVVMDVSFISMTNILGTVFKALKPGGHLLSLIKPQFELDRSKLNKNGVVKDPSDYDMVESQIRQACSGHQLEPISYFSSPITGKDGNSEFFVFAKKV